MAFNVDEFFEKAKKRAAEIIDAHPEYNDVIGMNLEMLGVRMDTRKKINLQPTGMDGAEISKNVGQGIPAFESVEITFDLDEGVKLFSKLLDILAVQDADLSAEAKKIAAAAESGDLDVSKFLNAMLEEGGVEYIEDVASRMETDPQMLSALAVGSIRQYMEKLAEMTRPLFSADEWLKPFCPVCGNPPYIAELRGKEGERILHCSLCASEWPYYRLRCSSCGNQDHETLRFLYNEKEGPECRADVCDECRQYLKAIDRRDAAEPLVMEVEDWGTLHIDMLAEKEGFTRGG